MLRAFLNFQRVERNRKFIQLEVEALSAAVEYLFLHLVLSGGECQKGNGAATRQIIVEQAIKGHNLK